jgi:hypothetical protein
MLASSDKNLAPKRSGYGIDEAEQAVDDIEPLKRERAILTWELRVVSEEKLIQRKAVIQSNADAAVIYVFAIATLV